MYQNYLNNCLWIANPEERGTKRHEIRTNQQIFRTRQFRKHTDIHPSNKR